ncbi:MAG TPA: hypothetical protein DCP28_37985, partial [Cytophagales bacterium]|nr:hypothetical protein [Cytophagales bacterium]
MVEAILKNGDKIKLPTTFDDGVQIKIIGQPAPLMGMGLSKLDGQKVVRQVDTDDHFIAAVMYDRGAFQKGLGNVSIKPGSVTASEITTDSGEPVALADSGYTA